MINRARGFVVYVVLLVLAVISVVAIGQLNSVNNESIVGVRREEEAQARALAAGCLVQLQRHAECFLDSADLGSPCGSTPGAVFGPPYDSPNVDFDLLLNPNDSAALDGDEFLPAMAGRIVKIPNTANGQTWKLVTRAGGACLMRFEDNSDDAFPANSVLDDAGTHTCGGAGNEGTGVDINFCDRDKAIYLTAIGIFPVDAAASGTQAIADAAYAKAHSRVTLRKLFAAETPSDFPAGITSAGEVSFKNNSLLCGAGGIAAESLDATTKGTSCMCGPIETNSGVKGGAPIGSACPCPPPVTTCNPGTQSSGNPTPKSIDIDGNFNMCAPSATLLDCALGTASTYTSPLQPRPIGGSYLSNNGFGNPYAGTNIALPPGLNNLSTNKGNANIVTGPPAPDICEFFFDIDAANSVYYFDSGDADTATTYTAHGVALAGPTENCTSYAKAVIETPCTYDGPPTANVTCVAGQTSCWKLLGRLDGVNVTYDNIPPGRPEMTFTSPWEQLAIDTGADLPFSAAKTRFSTAGVTGLCGAPSTDAKLNSCSNCDGVTGSINATGGAGDWTFYNANNNTLPVPFIAVINGRPKLRDLGNGAAPNLPLHASFLVSDDVDLQQSASNRFGVCCAECDCTGMGGLTINPATACRRGDGVTPAFAPSIPNPPGIPGFAFRTDNDMNLDIDATIIGGTWIGDDSTVSQSACVVGTYVVGGDFYITSNNNTNFVDDAMVVGNTDAPNNATFKGNLWMEGTFSAGNSFTLIGRMYGNSDIEFKNSARILWDGGGMTGAFGNNALSSFMESQW